MIWLYAALSLLPWTFAAPVWLARFRKQLGTERTDGFLSYAVLWTVMPLVFFTVSGNIILPYALTMVPGFAVLATSIWARRQAADRGRWMPALAMTSGILMLAATLALAWAPERFGRTQKPLVAAWLAQHPAATSRLVLWDSRREFSAEFYARGRLITTHDEQALREALARPGQDYLASRDNEYATLPDDIKARWAEAGRFHSPGETMLLLKKRTTPPSLP